MSEQDRDHQGHVQGAAGRRPRAGLRASVTWVLGGLCVVLALSHVPRWWSDPVRQATATTSAARPELPTEALAAAEQTSAVNRWIAKTALPGVVSISAARGRTGRQNEPADEPADDEDPGLRVPRRAAFGSGVIIDPAGYVVTNNHVVEDALAVSVRLNDGRRYSAEILGRDPKTDLAILKVDAPNLPVVALGDSDVLEVGDRVLAIGNPFNLQSTMTEGIVSAKGRADLFLLGPNAYENFIQTDAAINPGNSGGALVNLRGELVGINTGIATDSDRYGGIGIGFAVPVNQLKRVMPALIKGEPVQRGWLGVSIRPVTERVAESLSTRSGVRVADLVRNAPAAAGGLRVNDIILKVNGNPVRDVNGLRGLVADQGPGSKVSLLISRDGKEQTLTVTLGLLPEEPLAQAPVEPQSPEPEAPSQTDRTLLSDLGLAVSDMTRSVRLRFNLPAEGSGVVITRIDENGIAEQAGLAEGEVILQVNEEDITNTTTLTRMISTARQAKAKEVEIQVRASTGDLRTIRLPTQ